MLFGGSLTPHQRSSLGNDVEVELIRFIAMSALAFMNFRLPVSERVTASDAASTRGGLCVSRGLSPYGLADYLRPPLRRTTQLTQQGSGLVRKLLGQVSVEGEDILLHMSTDVPARYHRLRASLPSKLWRWKDVIGWRWRGDAEHINALELRAVKTSLVWRIKELREGPVRFVHLVDSLVVLQSRGRSSSRKLRRTLAKISALLLASGSVGAWSYVDTHQNPADRPSRRPVRMKWVRKAQK